MVSLQHLPPDSASPSIHKWWKKCRILIDKQNKALFDGLIIYFWWKIWKERNRRVFNHESKPDDDVAFLIKEDIQQFQLAKPQEAPTNEAR
jgi:hypothetical protein